MAPIYKTSTGWHDGEEKIHSLLHVPDRDNPTSPGLAPYAARLLTISSLIAVGAIDNEGRPWTTLWSGEQGFAQPLGQSIVGVKAPVDRKYDPVVDILLGNQQNGETDGKSKGERIISVLGIHLASRERVKLWAKIIAIALGHGESGAQEKYQDVAEIQAVFAIQQSLGNCPKYINQKRIIPRSFKPVLLSDSIPLSGQAIKLLAKADMFFISSYSHESIMGTNHRGGPPGFVRVASNGVSGTTLVYPELSGNRFYQTLGNLYSNPQAGLVFPDYDTGDVLYISGTTEIIVGKMAAAVLPRSNLVVKVVVTAARLVQSGLSFRAEIGERSPYNPPVRYLLTERALPDAQSQTSKVVYAKLLARSLLTPTIARFRFSVSDPEASGRWRPGQYVALAFEDELSLGYSHMRDDDPKSLNDDYARTFTVSSPPGGKLPHDEFEITIRNVGAVTNFLFRQNVRAELEVPLKGFGGSFAIRQGPEDFVPFVAGGIGITPILAQLPDLDLARIRLLWTINVHDAGLVLDTFERCPLLAQSTKTFISRIDEVPHTESQELVKTLTTYGAKVVTRRMLASDVEGEQGLSSTWYLCTGTELRKSLLLWLPGKTTIYEDFDY